MYMISIFAYHGDIVHYLSVDLYSTEPPEARTKVLAFLVLPSVYKDLRRFDTYNCIALDTN